MVNFIMFNSATVEDHNTVLFLSRFGLEYSEMRPIIKTVCLQENKDYKECQCECRQWSSHDPLPDPLGSAKNRTVEITRSPWALSSHSVRSFFMSVKERVYLALKEYLSAELLTFRGLAILLMYFIQSPLRHNSCRSVLGLRVSLMNAIVKHQDLHICNSTSHNLVTVTYTQD